MKKLISLTIACIAFSFTQAQVTNGLVAHWSFDGHVQDSSGNGHHGNAYGISYVQGRDGMTNTAADFSGNINSYVSVPHASDLNLDQHTVIAIVKVDSFYLGLCQASFIIMKGKPHNSGTWGMAFHDNAKDSSCAITNDTSDFVLYGEAGTNNASIPLAHWQTSNTIRTNTWYCMAYTWDGSTMKVYMNGQQISSATPSASPLPIRSNTDSVYMGANKVDNPGTYPYWLNGAVDDIKVYNRVLDSLERDSVCNPNTTNIANITDHEEQIIIYPNPTTDQMSVEATYNIQGAEVAITNMTGQVVIKQTMNGSKITINTVQLPAGSYIISLTDEDGFKYRQRFIKK